MVFLRPEDIKTMPEAKQARLKAKGPKRTLHFSDGDLEEYSTEEEDAADGGHNETSLVDPADFDLLISLIGPRISKQHTNYRECIPAEMRLAITLRFLATGDSYSSLMYLFRVSRPLICKIIPEVCACIIEALKEHVKRTLKWGPWISYLMWSFGSSTLSVVDTVGEFFAKAFGITTPRYYFELEEYKKREEEQATKDAEAQGWSQPAAGSAPSSTITSLHDIPTNPHPVDV
nr:unnamed protein product [Callosobruchus chinensis]